MGESIKKISLVLLFLFGSHLAWGDEEPSWMNFNCNFTAPSGSEICKIDLAPHAPTGYTYICENSDVKAFYNGWSSCRFRGGCAATACSPVNSPTINGAKQEIGQAIDIFGTVALGNQQMSCSAVGKVLRIATMGAMGFRVTCGASKKSCESACATADSALQKLANTGFVCPLPAEGSPPTTNSNCESAKRHFMDLWKENGRTIADNDSEGLKNGSVHSFQVTCKGYGEVLMQAGGNLVQTIAQGLTAENCKQETDNNDDACKKNPNSSICQTAATDCSVDANKSTQYCICKANPRDPSCGNTSSQNYVASKLSAASNSADLASTASPSSLSSLDGLSTGVGLDPVTKGAKGGTNFNGGKGGSGAPGGGGSGGPGGKKPENTAASSRFNTNISGGEGGGGGGGRFGSYGSGSKDLTNPAIHRNPSMDYKQFLPGGAKAKVSVGLDGITGPAGMSLWEKVSRRYRENRSTLEP